MGTLDRLLSHLTVDVEPFALCTLSNGWRLRLPPPTDAVLHFVLEGSGIVRGAGDLAIPIQPFSLAVVPRQSPHALEAGQHVDPGQTVDAAPDASGRNNFVAGSDERPNLLVACGGIQARYGDSMELFGQLPEVTVVDLSHFPQVSSAFEGILAEEQSPEEGSTALKTALMSQCLIYLLRGLSEQQGSRLPWLAALDDADLGPVLDAMLDQPGASHSVESLADLASMSRSTFASRFLASFGETPLRFLHEVRMRRAASLLQQRRHESIEHVARHVGFASRSRFSAAFKERFKMTPAVFRATSD